MGQGFFLGTSFRAGDFEAGQQACPACAKEATAAPGRASWDACSEQDSAHCAFTAEAMTATIASTRPRTLNICLLA